MLIISPITEEVLFRYLIFKNLYKIYGLTPALLVSSLSFGLIHLQFGLGQSLAAITLGLFLAYLYQKTDSLLFIITIHLTANLANFFPDLPYSARKIGLPILGLCFCFSLFKVQLNFQLQKNQLFHEELIFYHFFKSIRTIGYKRQ
ncbi:CPBP family intramembrane glutamic endopeptidase, partial [Streptococcus sobrinus]|uniref:CPBP family intramembrane glutamic endopeptidase n=1 Tax=Streptococcus sobrinus TaxID=1310 RepID=UPI0020D260D4